MKESYGLRVALTDGTFARIWGGIGDLDVPADAIETATVRYRGAGELLNLPDFQALINGIAERLTIGVSGVTPETLAFAQAEALAMQGAQLTLVRFNFDDNWQLVGVEYENVFRSDSLTTNSQSSENGRTRSISLSVGTDNTDRSRAPIAFFTDADQRRRSSDDAIFDHVGGITSGTSRRFGPT